MAHVVVIGAGAIGSHLLPHVGRSPAVSRVTVIDRDRYDHRNLQGQDIDTSHVGRRKAPIQAGRLRRINPHLRVTPICSAVEDVPLGSLRASVLLACLDSRRARMVVNQAAWRLGVPWIDAGISADSALARVRVFRPSAESPCLECGWDESDYAAVEQTYPCAPEFTAPSTHAPAALGALAASLQAIECDRLLAGDAMSGLESRETLLDARHQKHYVTAYRRNAVCRMPDHEGWRIEAFDGASTTTTLDDLLAVGSTLRGAGDGLSVGVAGQPMTTELGCDTCEAGLPTLQLVRHIASSKPGCPRCGRTLHVRGHHRYDMASSSAIPFVARERTLSACGLLPHDVVTLSTPDVDVHLELLA